MKTMKKFLALVSALALAVCVCTACSDNKGDSGKSSTNAGSDSAAIKTADDLKGKKIGVQLGTTGDIYAGDVEDATVERYNKGADAIMALTQGKVDCVIIDEQPAKVFVSQNDNIQILPEEFTNEEYAAVIKKDNTDLLEKVNKALADIKADGTLDKIIASYIPADDEEGGSYHYTQTVTDGDNLVMATNAEFPPYESYNSDGEMVGFDIDMMNAVCDYLGYELKIEDMPFDDILDAVANGDADVGVAGLSVTNEREDAVLFTDTYATTRQVIIVRK